MDENKLSISNNQIVSSQLFNFHKSKKKYIVVATRKLLKEKKSKNNSSVISKGKKKEMLDKKLKLYKENTKLFSSIQLAFKQRE